MLDEVPARGTGRLERKLSLDVHVLIPKFVSGRQKQEMISIAEDIARQYGCRLAPRKVSVWRRCFYRIFGGVLPINVKKLEDEEKGEEMGERKAERKGERKE